MPTEEPSQHEAKEADPPQGPMLDSRTREGQTRLLVGFTLNVALWQVIPKLFLWGGIDREFRFAFLGGSLAAFAATILLPVLWRGRRWQAVVALALLCLPGLAFLQVGSVLLKHWWLE